jgi:hypothetical protein
MRVNRKFFWGRCRTTQRIAEYWSEFRPANTGSVEGIAGEIGGQTDNGEEKPHAET